MHRIQRLNYERKILIAIPTIKGIVTIDSNVVTETNPTDTSTSLPYFAANIESIAATGAEVETINAIAIVELMPKPRSDTKAPSMINGIPNKRSAEAASAGAQRKYAEKRASAR